MIIDTHCHIDLYPSPEKILRDCVKADLTILAMTNLPSHFEMGYNHFKSLKKIRLALGMHPLMADSHKREFNLFLNNLNKTSYIGEVGLDFSRDGIATKDIQIDTFTKILGAISGQKKILSIHSRKAEKEVLELLKINHIRSAIFHWYSGGLKLIDSIAQSGYYFSINPAMLRSASGRNRIRRIPKEQILLETDGPFVNIKQQTIKPGDTMSVINYLSSQWKIDKNEVEKIISSNCKNLINSLK